MLVFLTYADSFPQFLLWTLFAVLFSTVMPFIYVYNAVKKGKITDVHVAVREERKAPFMVAMLGILLATLFLHIIGASKEIIVLGAVMFANGVIFFIITLYWKISMHLSILAGVIVSLAFLVNPYFVWAFLLVPILIWARIKRHRHTVSQGITATLLSSSITFILFRILGHMYLNP